MSDPLAPTRQPESAVDSGSSSWSHVLGALLDPRPTFQSISRKPTWLLALSLLLIGALAFQLISAPKIDAEATIRASLERSGQEIDEAQIQQGVEVMQRFGWVFGVLGALVFQPLLILALALVFWITFKLLGSDLDFRRSWSTTLHALMPLVVVTVLSTILVSFRDTVTAEQLQGGLLKSNLGAFVGSDASAARLALFSSIDFFSIWIFALYGIGFTVVTRLNASTVWSTVVVFWVVWVLGKVGLASLGALFGGGG